MKKMQDLNRIQLENALKTMSEWFPDEADKLINNKSEIVDYLLKEEEPDLDSVLLKVDHVSFDNYMPLVLIEIPDLKLTPCQEACGYVAVDVVFFALGLVGLHVSNQDRMSRAIIRELGPTTLRGLARAIYEFRQASSATGKATALFTLMGQIWYAGGFKAAFGVLKDEMSWWEWTKTGTLAILQITAWFATDGIAFIAEAALSIMSAEQLIEDSVKATEVCG